MLAGGPAPLREPLEELDAAQRGRILALAGLVHAAGVLRGVQPGPEHVLLGGHAREVNAREGLPGVGQRPPRVAPILACMHGPPESACCCRMSPSIVDKACRQPACQPAAVHKTV
jgi:hypothetical protein